MQTCEIKWIDRNGKATPDNNPAIGRVQLQARDEWIAGRVVQFPTSDWYLICACHAQRLNDAGMHNWKFEAIEAA